MTVMIEPAVGYIIPSCSGSQVGVGVEAVDVAAEYVGVAKERVEERRRRVDVNRVRVETILALWFWKKKLEGRFSVRS